mgnify:CR=1 FL=1
MKKIFSLLALVLFINLFTYQTQAQTAVVNINKTSVSLKELIQEVEKQAGYLFVYGKDINIEQKVKINARNKQVKALLENVLPQIGLTYEYADNYISLKKTQVEKKSIGKKIIVKGTNIMEQGSASNGTITDIDGKFTLSLPSNSVLAVTYVGFSTKNRHKTQRKAKFYLNNWRSVFYMQGGLKQALA